MNGLNGNQQEMTGPVETREKVQDILIKIKMKLSASLANACPFMARLKGKRFEIENCAFKKHVLASPGHFISLV